MRVFWWTLLVSLVVSTGFWSFGFAQRISPAHPFRATFIATALCTAVAQAILTYDRCDPKRR